MKSPDFGSLSLSMLPLSHIKGIRNALELGKFVIFTQEHLQ